YPARLTEYRRQFPLPDESLACPHQSTQPFSSWRDATVRHIYQPHPAGEQCSTPKCHAWHPCTAFPTSSRSEFAPGWAGVVGTALNLLSVNRKSRTPGVRSTLGIPHAFPVRCAPFDAQGSKRYNDPPIPPRLPPASRQSALYIRSDPLHTTAL